jgi:transcriptional regulator of acetoin/glycerol metabolism
LPPLADRREDLGLAIAAALKRHARRDGTRLTIEAALRMFHDPWPLNLRAVDHAIERALALAGDQPIAVEHLPELAGPDARPVSDDELRQQLIGLLRTHRGNVSGVARELGKARMQIQRWLRRFALDPQSFRR